MSYLSGPTTYTGTTLIVQNPGSTGNKVPPVAVQIRNASAWVISTTTAGETYLIDPFTASTVPITSSESQISLIGTLDAYPSLPNGYVTLEWLVNGETASEPDGPLTAAATVSAILSGNVTNTPAARQVFQGAYTPGVNAPMNINLQSTDRSLVVLLNTVLNSDRLSVIGNQSGAGYSSGTVADTPEDWGWSCPAYGSADTSVSLVIANTTHIARTLTILALPDELVFGETWAPESVQLMVPGSPSFLGVAGSLGTPMLIMGSNTPMGGLLVATNNNTLSGGTGNLLASNPPAGTYYRLHRLASPDMPSTGGPLSLIAAGNFVAEMGGALLQNDKDLTGQLVNGTVTFFNGTSVNNPRIVLTYDQIPTSAVPW